MQDRRAAALLTLVVLGLAAGCATVRPVPLPEGGAVDAARSSVTQTQGGVTVTVRARAWTGSPGDLEFYVLPLHLTVRNDTGAAITVEGRDIVLLDDEGRQYNALQPAEVAQLLQAQARAPVVFAPWPYRRSLGWPYFYDPFYDPLGGWWWYPPRYQPVHDVFGLALRPGVLRPGARLEGFVYFPPPPGSVRQFDAVVDYQVEGAPARSELRFPFALTRNGD
jgi:hypothetical protein